MATFPAVCPKCGVIKKSGKANCCARGGSWFGNCGSVSNAQFDHTWSEGSQACKIRTKFKLSSRERSAMRPPMLTANTVTNVAVDAAYHTSAGTRVVARAFNSLLELVTHISLVLWIANEHNYMY